MPLSWNEIRSRATTFASEWQGTKSEDADAKPFWDAFFEVFGVSRRKVASFEKRVNKLGHSQGKIDLLWKGTLLIEHKSLGRVCSDKYPSGQVTAAKGLLCKCKTMFDGNGCAHYTVTN